MSRNAQLMRDDPPAGPARVIDAEALAHDLESLRRQFLEFARLAEGRVDALLDDLFGRPLFQRGGPTS